ncbi:MAG TPA: hypothetical protein VGA99_05250 [bacterium]
MTVSWAKSIRPFFATVWQHRPTRIIFLLAVTLPTIAVLVLTVLLPAAYPPFDDTAEKVSANTSAAETDFKKAAAIPPELPAGIAALKAEEAYWQARHRLAKTNAVQLSIDLRDSVVSLDIRGVSVHRTKIHRVDLSRAIKRLQSLGRLQPWLLNGFILQQELATLPKAPIRIKEAPKDTIEASESAGEELEVENRDVHFTWHFDRQLTVYVEQVQRPSFGGIFSKAWYNFRRSIGGAGETLYSLAQLQLPRHRMWIELELPRDDAKAIYRALPPNAGLALRP